MDLYSCLSDEVHSLLKPTVLLLAEKESLLSATAKDKMLKGENCGYCFPAHITVCMDETCTESIVWIAARPSLLRKMNINFRDRLINYR